MTPTKPSTPGTPLPWKFSRTHQCSSDRWYVITDAAGYGPIVDVGGKDVNGQIAEAKYLITDPATIEANAAYIVEAANAYPALRESRDALVEALRELLIGAKGYMACKPWRSADEDISRAEAALTKAGAL